MGSKARDPNGVSSDSSPLDETNRAILAVLDADPRASMVELGRRVGLSAPAVRERVARMEESGVIRGYRLDVDPAALGLPVAAWVRIRPSQGQVPKLVALVGRLPEISECHRISGEDCFLAKVHVPSIDALEVVLDRLLLHGQTTTSFVVSTPVPARTPAPSG